MGVDISSKLIVGLEYKDIKSWIDTQLELEEYAFKCAEDVLEYYNLEYASPFYDSSPKNWFIGFRVKGYDTPEIVYEHILVAAVKFKLLIGKDGIVNATHHVY